MAKTTDVPHELRALNKIFSEKDYSWDYADSFRDWIDFLVESFMPVRQGEYERLKKKHKDLDWFVRMTNEWVMVQHRMINDREHGWYDSLGTLYEILSSRGKRDALGQFFTPECVCDFMTTLQLTDPKPVGKTINDPACGSGRLLLSFHAHASGNFQYGADLDAICAKMTAVNMCLHGCVGQAVCMDSLNPDDWRFGYEINKYLNRGGWLSIVPIQKEQCYTWRLWQQEKAEWEKKKAVNPAIPAPEPPAVKMSKHGQLSLF
ncbi:N-6 DNA methylase [Arsenicibacter rosenii]|uniref:site-specific DNA-methyltransferase (adenine-specific) n=1 Tax=Arsenicibacter rosenii TaxID=1750698 RepID=A0A1S2VS59_9BACT|nr:N-6 DNA methylase [Arsenicibacter rosenii]OIN61175.1 type I restriction endonuclease subunit M [Arsenicibacter rosenii]